jgi:hypothetical protein
VARQVNTVEIPVSEAGSTQSVPPTFLEGLGGQILVWSGLWVLITSTALIILFIVKLPAMPGYVNLPPEEFKTELANYKQLCEVFLNPIKDIFDITVTKTVIPIVTLLLGYLFGKGKS